MNSSSQTTSTSHFDTIGSEDNGDVRQQVIDLDDSNVYVQELRNVFLDCCTSSDSRLDENGLLILCDKLQLSAHAIFIVSRILSHPLNATSRIDFSTFKTRFVQLLPEIVNLSSQMAADEMNDIIVEMDDNVAATCSSSASNKDDDNQSTNDYSRTNLFMSIEKTLHDLGLGTSGFLDRYEMRILCQHMTSLTQLTSSAEINAFFDRIDNDGDGRISIQEFVTQVSQHKCNRVKCEKSYVSMADGGHDFVGKVLNLFQCFESTDTGIVDKHEIVKLWSRLGFDAANAHHVLEELEFNEDKVDVYKLSSALEQKLFDAGDTCMLVRAAHLSYHMQMEHLRSSLMDACNRADHLQNQLSQANQRHTLLVDEFESSQRSIELVYESRIRDADERAKLNLAQMDDRHRLEKAELERQLEACEDEKNHLHIIESTARNKLMLVDRQCSRLTQEAQEMTETLQEMEQLNRQLRQQLNTTTTSVRTTNNDELTARETIWRHKVEQLLGQNKRLRNRIDELSTRALVADSSKSRLMTNTPRRLTPLYAHCSTTFRTQLLGIRRRRKQREEKGTLSEMESEPESIFARPKRRRPLSVRERRQKLERRQQRIEQFGGANSDGCGSSSSSSSFHSELMQQHNSTTNRQYDEETPSVASSSLVNSSLLGEQFRLALATDIGDKSRKQQSPPQLSIDRLNSDHRRELMTTQLTAKRTMADALSSQERELTDKHEKEKRELQIRFASEKNALERSFAEEKVAMMSRLQEELEQEVRRIRMTPTVFESSIASSSPTVRAGFLRQIKILESSLEGQRNGYERRLEKLRSDYEKRLIDMCARMDKSNVAQLKSIIDPYSKTSDIDKEPVVDGAAILQDNNDQKSRCVGCELVQSRLRDLEQLLLSESCVESGIEDVGSSADSVEDRSLLKRENGKLRQRLRTARDKLIEIRLCIAMNTSQQVRQRCAPQTMNQHHQLTAATASPDVTVSAALLQTSMGTAMEQLQEEIVLFDARLRETQQLLQDVVTDYANQLRETARLGHLLQQTFVESPSSLNIN